MKTYRSAQADENAELIEQLWQEKDRFLSVRPIASRRMPRRNHLATGNEENL